MSNGYDILKEKLDNVFSTATQTQEITDLYEEVLMNLKEACHDYVESGISEEEAIEKAFIDLGVGDLDDLLKDLSNTVNLPPSSEQNLSSDNFDQKNKPFFRPITVTFSKKELVNHVVIPMGSIANVSIQYSSDSVDILPSLDGNFHIKEYMNIKDERLFAKWQVENNTLTITEGRRPIVVLGHYAIKIVICIPSTYHHNLSLKMTSGSVKIEELADLSSLVTEVTSGSQKLTELTTEDLKVTGTSGSLTFKKINTKSCKTRVNSGSIKLKQMITQCLDAITTSGSIQIEDSTISGPLALESTSGSLKLSDTITHKMTLHTTSGSIKGDISKVSGTFKSRSGSIKLITSELTDTIDLSSTSGSISLQLKEEQAFTYKLRFGSGSGKVKLPKTMIHTQKSHALEGYVCEPGDVLVNAETLSGSITIKEA